MDFYFSSINIVTVYNEKFNISNEVAYKARRLAALREMTWDIRVDVEKQAQKNQEAKKKAKKEKKRLKKERERRAKETTQDKDFSETDTNDKDEYCYRGKETLSRSTLVTTASSKQTERTALKLLMNKILSISYGWSFVCLEYLSCLFCVFAWGRPLQV